MSQLISAIRRNDFSIIKQFKRMSRPPVNLDVVEHGKSALMYACDQCHKANSKCTSLKLLLKPNSYGRRADPNMIVNWRSTQYSETTALIYCVYKHNFKAVKILLEKGADPNLKLGSYRGTALGFALLKTQTQTPELAKIIKLLLNYGADPYYVYDNFKRNVNLDVLYSIMNIHKLSLIHDTLLRQQAAYPSLMSLKPHDRAVLAQMSQEGLVKLLPEMSRELDRSLKSPGFSTDLSRKLMDYIDWSMPLPDDEEEEEEEEEWDD